MFFGNNQSVSFSERVYIQEGEKTIIFSNFVAWDFAIDNFCENVDMSFNAIVLGEKGKK